jgi:hypothetical protein
MVTIVIIIIITTTMEAIITMTLENYRRDIFYYWLPLCIMLCIMINSPEGLSQNLLGFGYTL